MSLGKVTQRLQTLILARYHGLAVGKVDFTGVYFVRHAVPKRGILAHAKVIWDRVFAEEGECLANALEKAVRAR